MPGQKRRFEVFKRDSFKCSYCGQTPPAVVLQVDHMIAVVDGGKDDINNLVTACFDCNSGKGARRLTSLPATVRENLEAIQEKEEQIREYHKFLSRIERRYNKEIEEIEDEFRQFYPGYGFTDRFKRTSLRRFVELLPKQELIRALQIAAGKMGNDRDSAISYFCGICWKKIKRES